MPPLSVEEGELYNLQTMDELELNDNIQRLRARLHEVHRAIVRTMISTGVFVVWRNRDGSRTEKEPLQAPSSLLLHARYYVRIGVHSGLY